MRYAAGPQLQIADLALELHHIVAQPIRLIGGELALQEISRKKPAERLKRPEEGRKGNSRSTIRATVSSKTFSASVGMIRSSIPRSPSLAIFMT